MTRGDSALRLSERANVLSKRAAAWATFAPTRARRLQAYEGALRVPLNALERLAPNEHAPEPYRRWMEALTPSTLKCLTTSLPCPRAAVPYRPPPLPVAPPYSLHRSTH
jgi:hypothetical protein